MKTKQLHKKEDDRDIIELEALLKDAGDRIDETEGDHILNLDLDENGEPLDEEAKAFDPSQARDESGRWTSMGGMGATTVPGPATTGPSESQTGETDDHTIDYAAGDADVLRAGGAYERPNIKPLAPKDIPPHQRNNDFETGPYVGRTGGKPFVGVKGSDPEMTQFTTYAFQKIAKEELETNFQPAMDKWTNALKGEGVEILSTKMRAKEYDSLLTKMKGKWADREMNNVTDGIGGRMVFRNQQELDKALIKSGRLSGMKILEHRDFQKDGKGDGYHATHLLVKTPGGMVAELQLKTHNQNQWSKWGHDGIYKAPKPGEDRPDFSKNKEAKAYATAVANYLREVDRGRVPKAPRPKAPASVKAAGMEFPWDKADMNPYGKKNT